MWTFLVIFFFVTAYVSISVKYWGNVSTGRPPPHIFGVTVPQSPLSLRPCVQSFWTKQQAARVQKPAQRSNGQQILTDRPREHILPRATILITSLAFHSQLKSCPSKRGVVAQWIGRCLSSARSQVRTPF